MMPSCPRSRVVRGSRPISRFSFTLRIRSQRGSGLVTSGTSAKTTTLPVAWPGTGFQDEWDGKGCALGGEFMAELLGASDTSNPILPFS